VENKEKLLARASGNARFWLLGVLVLALLARLVVLFGFTDFNSSASVDPYPEMATYMLDGQGMSKYYEDGSVRPVTSHGPLYPLVSAGFLLVSSRSWLVVRLAQVIVSVALVLLIYQVGRRAMNKEAGLLAAFLTAFYPPLVRFSADLMTETLFTFILILVVYFGLRFVREWTGWLALWLGVVLGLLILTKIKGLFIAIAFLPLLIVLARGWRLPWAVVPFVVAI
jgi:4-amino-4-deoxy-L-arabinose transferase-like glycosyltransferase